VIRKILRYEGHWNETGGHELAKREPWVAASEEVLATLILKSPG
jgi:hypothetical protein